METLTMNKFIWKFFGVITPRMFVIGTLTALLPHISIAQNAGGQIKRPQKIENKSISDKSKVIEKDYSGTDMIRLINQYLKNSKGENYAIPYDVFFYNRSLKEESDRVEMDEDGNYPFVKKYRAQLTIDGKSLGGIWYLALRGPRAGAYILEMQSSTSIDGMERIKKRISENLSGKLIKKDTGNVSMYSYYFYKIKNGYVLLDFGMGAGQVMVRILVSNMKEIIESEL